MNQRLTIGQPASRETNVKNAVMGRVRIALAKARLAAERGAAEIAELHLRDAMRWITRARQEARPL